MQQEGAHARARSVFWHGKIPVVEHRKQLAFTYRSKRKNQICDFLVEVLIAATESYGKNSRLVLFQ